MFSKFKKKVISILFFSISVLIVSVFFTLIGVECCSFAEPSAGKEAKTRWKEGYIIQPLPDFKTLSSWSEAKKVSEQYIVSFDNFHRASTRSLNPVLGGLNKVELKDVIHPNEDALIRALGRVNSPYHSQRLIHVLLKRIELKETHIDRVSRRLHFYKGRPAFDALIHLGPTAGLITLKEIGKEPDKERRQLMASLLFRVFRKKFALFYLEDKILTTAKNDKISKKEKEIHLTRLKKAMSEIKKMELNN
ncbi:hypothetical protein MNBD_PLANCTO02-2713 [hydrothermal vent metagenome]|uniref:Uncharacterized protein n=1 Tax=hydrothermal vent metagenome TaxID=652676 RepID=A0A3B1E7W8_9ZZZZ